MISVHSFSFNHQGKDVDWCLLDPFDQFEVIGSIRRLELWCLVQQISPQTGVTLEITKKCIQSKYWMYGWIARLVHEQGS